MPETPITLTERIDALLPQTQCARCGYPDCRAYAEAIAQGLVDIDRCPPGGDATLQALSRLLDRPAGTLAPEVGTFVPGTVAYVDETLCIGCTKCIQVCPVDAIAGAAKQMHTVIEALCTGCELCLPPCPVDCIRLIPAQGLTEGLNHWNFPQQEDKRREALRNLYRRRGLRLAKAKARKRQAAAVKSQDDAALVAQRRAEIAAARARVQAKRDAQKKA